MAAYENIDLRSEKVRDIIGRVPNGLIRDGIGAVSVILVLLGLVAFYVPYPESIHVNASITKIDDKEIEVTAFVPYRLVSKVQKGMSAEIAFEGYNLNNYGTWKAVVQQLDHSIVTMDGENYFQVQLSIDKGSNNNYALQKNMKGETSILLYDKSIIEYIFDRSIP